MKREALFVAILMVISIFTTSNVLAVDIVPWAHVGDFGPVFTFTAKGINPENMTAKVPQCKKTVCESYYNEIADRFEVEIGDTGRFNIMVNIFDDQILSDGSVRTVQAKENFPVRVGNVLLLPHMELDRLEGKAGYIFLIYPLFGYVLPRHIDAEMTFGHNIKKQTSFNCYADVTGYCDTGLIEMTADEYLRVLGNTYVCFKTADTETCQFVHFSDFLHLQQ